jgi:hypothetical protein
MRLSSNRYANLCRGLVAAWCPCIQRGPSNTLFDYGPAKYDGTLFNMAPATDWQIRENDFALNFAGTNDQVTFGSSTGPDDSLTEEITVSMWVRKTNAAASVARLISRQIAGGSGGFAWIKEASNLLTFYIWTPTQQSNAVTWANVSTMDHLVATYDGANIQQYINAIPVGTATAASGLLTATGGVGNNSWLLGGISTATQWLTGQMDDIRVYNRALELDEIKQLYSRRGIGIEQLRPQNRYLDIDGATRRRSSRYLAFPG